MPHPNIHAYHDSRFDPHVAAAHQFASELGLRHIAPVNDVTVIHGGQKEAFVSKFGLPANARGWNIRETGDVIAVADPDLNNPAGATARLNSTLVHEIAHSGSDNHNEHLFFIEGVAGLAENRYLMEQRQRGLAPKASHFVLERSGVRLFVPGQFRYYDSPTEKGAHSTQGLVAATGIVVSQQVSRIGVGRIMQAAKPGGTGHYDLVKESLNALRSGLAKEVASYPSTTDGIIQATAAIQDEARRQGIVPPLPRQ